MGKHIRIKLNETERTRLNQIINTGTSSASAQRRARILLLSDCNREQQLTAGQVAEAVMCSAGTVHNIKKRYVTDGLEAAIKDKPRPGAPPKITGEVEAHLIALACSEPPAGYAQWTLRLLGAELIALDLVESISHVAIGKVLKKMSSSPGE